jgi:DNA repair protein RadC
MKTKLFDQHSEHSEWMKNIEFYSVEMKIMQKRLDEVAKASPSKETLQQIEHFQNQIFIQVRHAAELSHQIKGEEKVLQEKIRENVAASENLRAEDHTEERETVLAFEKVVNDLRKEFNTFLSQQDK